MPSKSCSIEGDIELLVLGAQRNFSESAARVPYRGMIRVYQIYLIQLVIYPLCMGIFFCHGGGLSIGPVCANPIARCSGIIRATGSRRNRVTLLQSYYREIH